MAACPYPPHGYGGTPQGPGVLPRWGCEIDETSPEETAVREAGEEIGLEPSDIRILGRMNDVITITHFRSLLWWGRPWPYPVHPEPAEVARVFTIPLLCWPSIKTGMNDPLS